VAWLFSGGERSGGLVARDGKGVVSCGVAVLGGEGRQGSCSRRGTTADGKLERVAAGSPLFPEASPPQLLEL